MSLPRCPSCNAAVEEEASYCTSCGTDLVGGSEEPTETTSHPSEHATVDPSSGRTLAAITHILGLLTWIFGPLVVLLVSNDMFVRQNAKNALMWQVMLTIYVIISAILILLVVGIFLLIILGLLDLVFCIIAAVKASEGEAWSYPLTPSV